MFVKRLLFPLILVLVTALLFISNFAPDTYLLGWDNVMPEFNINLNLSRALSAVWQDYRGLGHIDAMAHAANLTHSAYIWLLSLALPESALRYVFILLAHLMGALGSYFLFKKLLKNASASLVGALFYMLNLATIQMFYAPLEVFAIHFAALPWLTLAIINTLKKTSPKNLALLLLTTFIFSAQGFVPTVFLASALMVFSFLFFFTVQQKPDRQIRFKKAFSVGLIIILGNLFWLLPYLFSLPQSIPQIQDSRINMLSSDELFARNKARGDLSSVLSLKGFMIDTVEYDHNKAQNVDFMDSWKKHVNTPLYAVFYFMLLTVATIGFLQGVKKKSYVGTAMVFTSIFAFVALANNTLILREINELIRTIVPILGEAFRIPFTKFATLFAFTLAYFLSVGAAFLIDKRIKWQHGIVTILVALIFYMSLPSFQGQFFSPLLKVKMPEDYHQLFDYMADKPETSSIAVLPLHTFWNWQYYDFGARGSGFLWYGLSQPILVRAFDPWNIKNEQAFNELFHSLRLEDAALFHQVIEKYNLSYLLLDEHLINNLSSKPINYDRLTRFLEAVPGLVKERQFGGLILYSTGGKSVFNSTANLTSTGQKFTRSYRDIIYENNGHYADTPHNNLSYPFANLYTETATSDNPNIERFENKLLIKADLSSLKEQSYTLQMPSFYASEELIPVKIDVVNRKLHVSTIYPTIIVDGKRIEATGELFEFPLILNGEFKISLNGEREINTTETFYVRNNFSNVFSLSNGRTIQRITLKTGPEDAAKYEFKIETAPRKIEIELIKAPLIKEHGDLTTQNKYLYTESLSLDEQEKFRCSSSTGKITTQKNGQIDFETFCQRREIAYFLPELPHNQAFLLDVQSLHQSGLPLKLVVDNPLESRSEYEAQFSSKNKQFFIIPTTQKYFDGYGLHFILSSTGFEKSKATLERAGIFPLPLRLLEQISISTGDQASASINPQEFTKLNDALYITSPKDKILIFNRAYSPNWHAYIVPKDSKLYRYLPFIFGKKIEAHFLVNNWANGWEISQSQPPLSGVQSKSVDSVNSDNDQTTDLAERNRLQPITTDLTIVLIFWPQYLEYIGLFALIIAFSFLGIKGLKPQK